MNIQQQELKVGLTVFAAVAALAILIVMFGKGLPFHLGNEYIIKVRFQRTPGISARSPVFKNGVEIGKVSNVLLVDEDREVEVSISLPKKRKIYTDEECRVRQTMIMGDASLEFIKNANYKGKIEIVGPDSPPLVGSTGGGLLDGSNSIESDLSKAIENVSKAAVQASELIGRANLLLGTPQELEMRRGTIDSITREMQATLSSMHQMSEGVNLFVNNPKFRENVEKIISVMPEVLAQTKVLMTESQSFIGDAKKLVDKGSVSLDKIDSGLDSANKALEGVKTITDSISGDVPEVMKTLKSSSLKLEMLFEELTTIAKAMNQADGTIKRLMRDPEAYNKLMETLNNVQKITGEFDLMLRTDIKPITYNVKIITDKIARDPSVFIRNLVNKQPRTKPLPVWGDGLGSDTLGSQTLDRFSSDSVYMPVCYETPKNQQQNCFQRFYSGVANTFKGSKKSTSGQCGNPNCSIPNCSGTSCGVDGDETYFDDGTPQTIVPQTVIPDAPKLAPKSDIQIPKPVLPVTDKNVVLPLIFTGLTADDSNGVVINIDPREQQRAVTASVKTAEAEPVLRFTR
ncbi:hypothetical protein FACS189427_08270 [Planctomycetales bacterium]|nr:hypothetical protein FACS189427_08270 [Planctomycetales bacterium]